MMEQDFELKHELSTEEVQERERNTNNVSRHGLSDKEDFLTQPRPKMG